MTASPDLAAPRQPIKYPWEWKSNGSPGPPYLGLTMPASAREATDGNASIFMFLDRHRGDEIFQHDIETRFCITRSTASRVLTHMEHKGLIIRKPVARDARLKRIVLTPKADRIVADLIANGSRAEDSLTAGFTPDELV